MISTLDDVVKPSPEVVSAMAEFKPASVLGLDIGTSGVRACLFDARGRDIKGTSVRLEHRASGLEDLAVADAAESFELVAQTIDEVLAKSLDNARIELISVSCFWHSLVGVDAKGLAVTPVFTWADTRAARAAGELRKRFEENAIHARTGCRLHQSYWPAKLLWLSTEQPETFRSVSRWLSFGEYVVLRLFGQTAASISMASGTGLFNHQTRAWDNELTQALGLSSGSLPEIAAPHKTLYGLTDDNSLRWPQLSQARLFPAIGDGVANSIGSGCSTRDQLALMVGTSGAMRVVYQGEFPAELPPELWCYRVDTSRVIVGGATSDGGGLHAWIREMLLSTDDLDSIEMVLEGMEPDAHGLTVLPFWAGERSTGWSTQARGAILGLDLHTGPMDILRAAMEAVAYRFALIMKALESFAPDASVIASGTALRSSAVWAQIMADVLGRPVTISGIFEASTRGAALLALEATGRIQNIAEVPIPLAKTFVPDMRRHERYLEGLERQQRIYERVIKEND